MAKKLKNKTIVVTGAAQGIGYQITKNYLAEEAKLAILIDCNEEEGKRAAEELNSEFGSNKAVFIKGDVTEDLKEITDFIFDKYRKVDVLVNSAGMAEFDVKKCVEINLVATMQWSFKFLEHMRRESNGTIINIGSILGYRISKKFSVYQATKYGVIGFTKSFGHEENFKQHGVRVFALCPGFTWTPLNKYMLESKNKEFLEIMDEYSWQTLQTFGSKTVEVFNKARSGSVWEIEGGIVKAIN